MMMSGVQAPAGELAAPTSSACTMPLLRRDSLCSSRASFLNSRRKASRCSSFSCRITSYNVCYTKLLRLFALGLTLYELLTGRRALHAPTDEQLLRAAVDQQVPPPSRERFQRASRPRLRLTSVTSDSTPSSSDQGKSGSKRT